MMRPESYPVQPTGLALALVAACLLATIPCSGAPGKPPPAKTVNVTDKENNRQAHLSAGDTLVVTLPSNPTTGYQWEIAKNDAKRLQPLGKPESVPPKSRAIGAVGQQVFRFQAKTAGETVLELHYRRPFEKDKPPARTYRLTTQIDTAKK